MFRGVGEAAGYSNRFSGGGRSAQLILAGTRHLSSCNKVWLFEIFENDADFRVAKCGLISLSHGVIELSQCQAFREHVSDRSQGDESIRLDRDGLVKFWRERELDFDHVTFAQPVQRTAFPRQGRTP